MRKLARTEVRKKKLFPGLSPEPRQKSARGDQPEGHWFLARIRRRQAEAGASPRLDADKLGQFLKELGKQWFRERIHGWRMEVGNRQRIDANAMDHVLEKLRAAELPTALPDYVVLGCEWLFRLRDFEHRDVQRFLDRVRLALEPIMGSTEAYVVTEAFAPHVRKQLRQHRQLAAVLEWEPPRMVGVAFPDAVRAGRPIEPVIPVRSGPAPWLAPWVAGLIVERLLEQNALDGRGLGLELAAALLGRDVVDEKEYRIRRGALKSAKPESEGDEPILDQLVRDFKNKHQLVAGLDTENLAHRCQVAAGLDTRDQGGALGVMDSVTTNPSLIAKEKRAALQWPDHWQVVLEDHLQVPGPAATFPFDVKIVRALYAAYRS